MMKLFQLLFKLFQEEQERFPLHTLEAPTAVVDDKKQEVYSNLILFTVVEDPGSRHSSADMHIFQSTEGRVWKLIENIVKRKIIPQYL